MPKKYHKKHHGKKRGMSAEWMAKIRGMRKGGKRRSNKKISKLNR
jgi:hypothetical protein